MFGSFGSSLTQSSITFVSKAGLVHGVKEKFALKKRLSAVQNIRQVRKKDMIHNDLAPAMDIDPQSYAVKANGELLTSEAARPRQCCPWRSGTFCFDRRSWQPSIPRHPPHQWVGPQTQHPGLSALRHVL
jgi:hypothetical protein